LQIFTHAQTGGAGSNTDMVDSYLKNYTVHQIQPTGVTTTATISVYGPGDVFTAVKTVSNNDILTIEGVYHKFRVTWADSSGGTVAIRSYNLDAIDGG